MISMVLLGVFIVNQFLTFCHALDAYDCLDASDLL